MAEEITFKNMNYDYVEAWVIEHKETQWLKDFVAKYAEEHEGKKANFIVIKRAFCEKFMPAMLPKAKKKSVSMYDRIANL